MFKTFLVSLFTVFALASPAKAWYYDGWNSGGYYPYTYTWRYHGYHPYWNWQYPQQQYYYPQEYYGGWRYLPNYGWDHSCVTPWLSDQFACSHN